MRALLGPVPAATAAKTSTSGTPPATRKKGCEQKYQADAALASDATGKARAYRRWQQCLKPGFIGRSLSAGADLGARQFAARLVKHLSGLRTRRSRACAQFRAGIYNH